MDPIKQHKACYRLKQLEGVKLAKVNELKKLVTTEILEMSSKEGNTEKLQAQIKYRQYTAV